MTTAAHIDPQGYLALLQLNDSLFPSGTFTHSFGLEQLAREGFIRRPEQLEAFAASVLRQTIATADVPASIRAYRAAASADLGAIIAADRALHRTKASAELRNAGLSTGRRLVEELALHLHEPVLLRYAEALRENRLLGMQPVAFGVACHALEVEEGLVPAALMLGAVNAILQAGMRLLPVSHRDVQAALHRLRPEIAALSARALVSDEPPRSFHPLQEIASMRHAYASARLFTS